MATTRKRKSTYMKLVHFFKGPLDGHIIRCDDLATIPTRVTVPFPCSKTRVHQNTYELICKPTPYNQMDVGYVLIEVTGGPRPR